MHPSQAGERGRLFLAGKGGQHCVHGGRSETTNNKNGDIGVHLQLQWFKCPGTEWCLLDEIDVAAIDGHGVFVIWRPGDSGRASVVLYVGQGPLRQRLEAARRDPIMRPGGALRVTWATVDLRDTDGVAAYLYQQLRPLWGEVPHSPAAPQPVNLPLTA